MNEVIYSEWTTIEELEEGDLFEMQNGDRFIVTKKRKNNIGCYSLKGYKWDYGAGWKVRTITLPPFVPPEPELLPCPFCGELPLTEETSNLAGRIFCPKHQGSRIIFEWSHGDKTTAIKAWNRRAS